MIELIIVERGFGHFEAEPEFGVNQLLLVARPDEVERVESFSRIMKLEPFERGMRELAPKVWITALRKEQNPQRAASLQPFMWDAKFQCLKVNPILDWTPVEMDAYLLDHDLPNERMLDCYYDPENNRGEMELLLAEGMRRRP